MDTIVPPDPQGIERAAQAIRAGQIVCYPTETVYGLGVNPFDERALHRLYAVKERDTMNPVLLIAADIDQVNTVTAPLGPAARLYAEAFWPGPLSLILPAATTLPGILLGGLDRVCIRCTPHPVARALCRAAGTPIVSTSANRTGEQPARALHEVDLPGIAVGIDGGILQYSPPSTVLDPETGVILRSGAVSGKSLNKFARALQGTREKSRNTLP